LSRQGGSKKEWCNMREVFDEVAAEKAIRLAEYLLSQREQPGELTLREKWLIRQVAGYRVIEST